MDDAIAAPAEVPFPVGEPVERVGRLTVTRVALERGAAYRRSAAYRLVLELRGDADPAAIKAPGWIFALVLVLAHFLLAFAVLAGSAPAIGAVTIAIAALGALVIASRWGKARAWGRIQLSDDSMRWSIPGTDFRRPVERIESFGVGEDGALSSLFVGVEGEGRLLVLGGLTRPEAEAAKAVLEAEVRRRRAAILDGIVAAGAGLEESPDTARGLALGSVVCGVLGLALGFTTVPGIILALMAHAEIDSGASSGASRRLATLGLLLSSVNLVLVLLSFAAFVVVTFMS